MTIKCAYKILSSFKWHKNAKTLKVIPIKELNDNSNQVDQQINKSILDGSINTAKPIETHDSFSKMNGTKLDNFYQSSDHIKQYDK